MKEKLSLIAIIFIFMIATIATNGFAEESRLETPNPVADVILAPQGINFIPVVEYSSLSLRVLLPDGTLVEKAFNSGDATVFNIPAGVPEGQCTYELRVNAAIRGHRKRDRNNTDSMHTVPVSLPVQTGYFHVNGGVIMVPQSGNEISQPMDVIHLDDVIIDGSLCVGFDCINGESFGFDTLRLKENNLRIKFQDTSVSASFPTRDWEITVNDSANGGGDYFGITDIDSGKSVFKIEGATRANALYVDDSGRVGLGTATPSEDLHIWYGDTPTIRLAQSGSGWAPQTWDMAGNEANFFIRDVTNGSKLSFRIQPNTPSDTLALKSSGFVGFGTWSPEYKLHAQTTGEHCILVTERTDGATFKLAAKDNRVQLGSISNHDVRFTTNNTSRMAITTDGYVGIGDLTPTHLLDVGNSGAYCNGGAWVDGSSLAFKQDIRSIDTAEATRAVMNLRPVRFRYKTDTSEEFLGFIAEEVPELVAMKDRKGMTAMDVVAALTKVVQQQQQTIRSQDTLLRKLSERVKKLENKD